MVSSLIICECTVWTPGIGIREKERVSVLTRELTVDRETAAVATARVAAASRALLNDGPADY